MKNNLPILAIESSGSLCSACLYFSDEKFVEKNLLDKHIHSEKLFSIIDECRREFPEENEFKSIAVSIGPGSFTGLRIGLAAAKGIATGKNIPIIPVPTMAAFAFGISDFIHEEDNFVIADHVNRDELYFARFVKRDNAVSCIDEPKLVEINLIEKELSKNELLFGNYNHEYNQNKFTHYSACNIARWAYFFGKELVTFDYDNLEPLYLKNFIAKGEK